LPYPIDDQSTEAVQDRRGQNVNSAYSGGNHGVQSTAYFFAVLGMACDEIDAEVAGSLFDLGNGVDGGGVSQYADPTRVWDQLVEKGKPLGVEFAS
jgi:hypothetical protein